MTASESGSPVPEANGPRRSSRRLRSLIALVVIAAGIYWFVGWTSFGQDRVLPALGAASGWIHARLEGFIRSVEELGTMGPLVFILGYALAAVAFLPGSFLTLAAGAVFDLWRGVLFVFLGACLGAAAAFLVARYVARSAVERRIAGSARFAAIDRAIGKQGFKIVALLRLSPVFPYNLLNYLLGLTGVSFASYNLASFAMIPGTILYVYYGSLAKDVAELASGAPRVEGWQYYLPKVVGLVATVLVTTVVTRTATRALREATGAESEETSSASTGEKET